MSSNYQKNVGINLLLTYHFSCSKIWILVQATSTAARRNVSGSGPFGGAGASHWRRRFLLARKTCLKHYTPEVASTCAIPEDVVSTLPLGKGKTPKVGIPIVFEGMTTSRKGIWTLKKISHEDLQDLVVFYSQNHAFWDIQPPTQRFLRKAMVFYAHRFFQAYKSALGSRLGLGVGRYKSGRAFFLQNPGR